MHEKLPAPGEQIGPAEIIANTLENWLSEEIKSSNSGSNAYLMEYHNFAANKKAKSSSHYDRLAAKMQLMEEFPDHPEVLGSMIYETQMGISGAFRTQAYIRSNNARQYMNRRSNGVYGPSGIDLPATIKDHLVKRFGALPNESDLATKTVDIRELIERTAQVNELRRETDKKIYDDPKHNSGILKPLNNYFRLGDLQREWLALAVDYTLHSAYVNGGDLRQVTFLEPKTNTQARPYLPFK